MFDIGWDEMAVIAVVSLIVIGPKDLPKVLRQMGRWTRKAREMAAEFQRGVDDMVRESELDDLKKQVGKVSNIGQLEQEVKNAIDPTGSIANDLKIPALDLKAPETTPAEPAPAPAEPLPAEDAPKPIDVEQPHRPPEP